MDGRDSAGRSLARALLSIITYAGYHRLLPLFVPKWEIGPLCYNGSQRYCHGLLVTR